ncbi:class II aldolase/adducin family protein [Roseicitreum antarcticum]|uniref:Ribulose-5-phosphate 4-epimerase/Fuculose-1-phosphate aldolase n=1 Tax=Roseicitreum antarcticum TaxID=564137 RepID=A0A1H2W3C0_9RHOB|nr:class II aldolase/adducin family protein [Roseicitreum antarcticum]SDW74589.1 Ribulose-5-phosphate 4-epimerase/Fuculose-1-phosphate aldolase [Roseicitreum antarcticum]
MRTRKALIDDIVIANRILASEGVCDAFGHVSVRNPDNPDTYFLSRARSPELIVAEDIMEFLLDGTPVGDDTRKPYLERYIHGGIYEKRPDVHAVIHSHSRSVIPFTITDVPLRPVVHSCATIGKSVPVWDAQDSFGDTNLLISTMEMGRDFAGVLADGRSALMRGHGSTVIGKSLREAVYTAVYLEVNALLQLQAHTLGPVKFLTDGEIERILSRLAHERPGEGYDRSWEYWSQRAGITTSSTAVDL